MHKPTANCGKWNILLELVFEWHGQKQSDHDCLWGRGIQTYGQMGVKSVKVSSEAIAWDEGCRTDPIRNHFLIPKLVSLLSQERPATILDIGTGTGYIPRLLDSLLDYRPKWTLVDRDPERMEIAEQRKLPTMRMRGIVGSVGDLKLDGETYEAVLLTFTLLEARNPPTMLARALGLVADNGLLAIAVPDGWRDILTATDGDQTLCNRFLNESVELPKIDKFTGSPYPFFAMRTESLITAVLSHSCVLEALEQGGPNGEVYLLVFRKGRLANSAMPHA